MFTGIASSEGGDFYPLLAILGNRRYIFSKALYVCSSQKERRPLCCSGLSDGARPTFGMDRRCPLLRCWRPFSGGLSIAEKIPPPRFWKTRVRVSCSSPMANRMIRVRSQAAMGHCSSCTGEASRMWSAVCSLTITAGLRPGEKITPGGGGLTS
jgi:hypothetical protein